MATQTVEFYGLNNLPVLSTTTTPNSYTTTSTTLAFQTITAGTAMAGPSNLVGT